MPSATAQTIERLLDAAFPRLSSSGQKALMMLARRCAILPRCDSFAALIGAKNRFALSRLLHDEGLPSYRELAGWIQILAWDLKWEREHKSLAQQASSVGRYPGSLYRTVRRVTGVGWDEVRARGSDWVLLQLLACCRPPVGNDKTDVGVA